MDLFKHKHCVDQKHCSGFMIGGGGVRHFDTYILYCCTFLSVYWVLIQRDFLCWNHDLNITSSIHLHNMFPRNTPWIRSDTITKNPCQFSQVPSHPDTTRLCRSWMLTFRSETQVLSQPTWGSSNNLKLCRRSRVVRISIIWLNFHM